MEKKDYHYQTDVRQFAAVMLKNLKENSYKTGWKDCSFKHLLCRIREEVDEIQDGLLEGLSAEEIVSECADVANFAMMIADNVTRRDYETQRP